MKKDTRPKRSSHFGNLKLRLENYKKTQEKIAKSKGCYDDLVKARTLTEARKVVYGIKPSHK